MDRDPVQNFIWRETLSVWLCVLFYRNLNRRLKHGEIAVTVTDCIISESHRPADGKAVSRSFVHRAAISSLIRPSITGIAFQFLLRDMPLHGGPSWQDIEKSYLHVVLMGGGVWPLQLLPCCYPCLTGVRCHCCSHLRYSYPLATHSCCPCCSCHSWCSAPAHNLIKCRNY